MTDLVRIRSDLTVSALTVALHLQYKKWLDGTNATRLWTESQTCCGLCSVLLDNTQHLIQEQTRNDTTDPKSGGMNNERYHSLEDVNQELHTLTSERKKKHICILQFIILLWDLFMFLSRFIIWSIKQAKSIPTWPNSFWLARHSRKIHCMSWR